MGYSVSQHPRYASRIKIIHRSWREANKSVALPEEEEEKAPSSDGDGQITGIRYPVSTHIHAFKKVFELFLTRVCMNQDL